MPDAIDSQTFFARREARREAALTAAGRLLSGAPGVVLLPLLADWRFAGRRSVADHLAAALIEHPPCPSSSTMAAHLCPVADLPFPPSPACMSELEHQRRLEAVCPPLSRPDRLAALAWALAEIQLRGAHFRQVERRYWSSGRYRTDAARDAEMMAMWAALLGPRPWAALGLARRLLFPVARTVAREFFDQHELPWPARSCHLTNLEESFFGKLIADDGAGGGRAELAIRTLESTGQGHFDALVGLLSPGEAAALAWAPGRRRGALTAAAAWAGGCRGRTALGTLLEDLLGTDLGVYAGLAELNLVLRLVDGWAAGEDGTTREAGDHLTSRNLRRWTGRLRATVLAQEPSPAGRLLEIPALGARTCAALKRYTYAWLWDELHHGFTWDCGRPVTALAPRPVHTPTPIAVERLSAVSTWVCRALLRLEWRELEDWVRRGARPEKPRRLDELLTSLPEDLADAPQGRARRSYHRLRAFLCLRLHELARGWEERLGAIAGLDFNSRGLVEAAWSILGPHWDPEVSFPKKGFPKMIFRVRRSLDELRTSSGGGS